MHLRAVRLGRVMCGAAVVTATFGVVYRLASRDSFWGVVDLLGYFTIQSNLFVLAVAGFSLFSLARGRSVPRPGLRLAASVYITVTMVVYNLLLLPLLEFDHPIELLVGQINHTITPLLWVSSVLLTPDDRPVPLHATAVWLLYPALYALFATVEGVVTGRFRYFFVNIEQLGVTGYTLWLLAVTVLFWALAVGYRALYRIRGATGARHRRWRARGLVGRP